MFQNDELKNQLNFINTERRFVTSDVITRPPFSPYDTFVINANDQIRVDQKVFYKQLLIGRVIEVYGSSAIVKLFSSSDEKIAVKLLDNNFEAEGQSNLSFKIRIPKSLTVSENIPVYSAEANSVLGIVQSINSNEASAFQDVYFRYPISIKDLIYVEIEI